MTVLYFAWVREKVGLSQETVAPPASVTTVAGLVDWLAARGGGYAEAFKDRRLVRAAVDQVHSASHATIVGAKEVAFFPPVTGG
ncbi:MAG: molybdopterin converting factor subunit 1 [Rhodospirillaceae bacterium]|nr:molybdopterin converting factor subunit 1 [Rhodospirillaceae bacterium]